MKLAKHFLMFLAAAAMLLPATQAATRATNFKEAQYYLHDDGYALFIYGSDWDKRGKEICSALYQHPEIAEAAGKAVMLMVPLPESMDDAEKATLKKKMGTLSLPDIHSKHSFPAVVLYDKAGRLYTNICGPAMIYPAPERIALMISRRRAAMLQQLELMKEADKLQGEERARIIFQACRLPNIAAPDRAQELIREADPEDKTGCLSALNFYNTTLGDKANSMTLEEILAAQDKSIANPLLTPEQRQNACAYAIGTIRRRTGANGAELIRQYALRMKAINPDSVLGRSADVVMRDWTHGLQYVRGWSPDTLPSKGQPTELLGRLPIGPAGTYKLHFKPTGGHKAIVARVALFDGDKLISEDVHTTPIADNGQDHFYTLTAPEEVKQPRIFITFDNEANDRDTRGVFSITKD